MIKAASYGQLMSNTIVSGLFAIIGTTLGWLLSEAGAGWRGYAERRRGEQAEATARVFDAQALWNHFTETSRADIADSPAPFLNECKEIAKVAQDLVNQA